MKHYKIENGQTVDTDKMKAGLMPTTEYSSANANLIMACHDVFIKYRGGILLIKRRTLPAINIWWPLGGRILKGFTNEDSLQTRVKSECGLTLTNIQELGFARVLLGTDPFGHGKGVDALVVVYFAEGEGELKLDKNHESPIIVKTKDYDDDESFRSSLHPYVRDFLNLAIGL